MKTGKNPVIIFVYIASGVFGKQAFLGSQSIAIFGVLFHFVIAIIFSAFYFWIYPKMEFLHKNRLTSAVLYGIFVWLVMNLVVVPLTEYFQPSSKEFMINYRVENIEALVEELKQDGITVLDEIETFSYGKFVHILDPENNKIELWEPALSPTVK